MYANLQSELYRRRNERAGREKDKSSERARAVTSHKKLVLVVGSVTCAGHVKLSTPVNVGEISFLQR